jgi:hypothetical protein
VEQLEQQNHILGTDNYRIFCIQLQESILKYPNLRIKQNDEIKYLNGILDISDEEKNIIGSFLIEIHFSSLFPYRFPCLLETGGSILNEADWHKYQNSRCCITVEAEEILNCKHGISVIEFIDKYAIPFFANFIYRKENGLYKNGEYGHSIIGPFQFYSDLFKTDDPKLWVQYFKNVFRNLPYNKNRNETCFCGSKNKFKHCHRIVFEKIFDIGEKQVLKDFQNFSKE